MSIPNAEANPENVTEICRCSARYLVSGGLLVAGGLFIIAFPFFSSADPAFFVGWTLVASGLVEVAHALMVGGAPAIILNLLAGLLSTAMGVFILSFPGMEGQTLMVYLAGFFAADGIIRIVSAAQTKYFPGWGWITMNGSSSLALAGLTLWLSPNPSLYALAIVLGLDLLAAGGTLLLLLRTAKAYRPESSL